MPRPPEGPGGFPAGVEAIDHTADIGLRVRAPSLAELFRRAASGMRWLIEDAAPTRDTSTEELPVSLEAGDAATLLVQWLRELLYLHQVHGQAYVGAVFSELTERSLTGRVRCGTPGDAVREIKGVTYHDLAVARHDGEWRARVVFDV